MKINEIICGNNVDALKSFEDECIDLVVTSPPYDEIRDNEEYKAIFDFKGLAKQLKRVLKPGGVIVWVVADSITDFTESLQSFEQALYFKSLNLKVRTMIYAKNGFRNPYMYYQKVFEYMFIISKGKAKTFNPINDRIVKLAGSHRNSSIHRTKSGELVHNYKQINIGNEEGLGKRYDIWKENEFNKLEEIWEYNTGGSNTTKDKIAYEHPAIFPEQLAEDHIKSWSNPGDLVLDPFCGSGTTCKMAKLLHRNYIGIDVSQVYCDLAQKRIQNSSIEQYESKQMDKQVKKLTRVDQY